MGKKITISDAEDLCNNFDAKFKALCTIKPDDNRSALFTIEELEAYISEIKETEGIDGVRIYMGSYDDSKGPNGKSSDGFSTLFLVPTDGGVDNKTLQPFNFVADGPNKKY